MTVDGFRIKELESYTSQMMEDSHQGMQQMQQKLAVMERHFRDEQQAHTTTKYVPLLLQQGYTTKYTSTLLLQQAYATT